MNDPQPTETIFAMRFRQDLVLQPSRKKSIATARFKKGDLVHAIRSKHIKGCFNLVGAATEANNLLAVPGEFLEVVVS